MTTKPEAARPTHVRLALEKRGCFVDLRLRWESAPENCRALLDLLPISRQVWHAKYANNEIYLLCQHAGAQARRLKA